MSRIVVFGAGKQADQAYHYFRNDSPHEVVAFTVDRPYLTERERFGLPVIPFEEVQQRYRPGSFKMFVAIGYQDLNRLRARKVAESKAMGYELVSYVSSRASNFGQVPVGDNCFILEGAVVQPCATLGNNVWLWSGSLVGHHASIGDHCFIAGHAVISGNTRIEPFCFLGVNSTIGHELVVGAESFVGAGARITKSAAPGSVFIQEDTPRFRLDSSSFLRLTKMK
jgi:sugar O-acyltransferase (sialic acid O-acetyltransferase NeuD family)